MIDEPDFEEKLEVMKLHMDRLIDLKGEKIAVLEMRKHASWYLKGIKGNGTARKLINQAQTRGEVAEIVEDFALELKERQEKLTV